MRKGLASYLLPRIALAVLVLAALTPTLSRLINAVSPSSSWQTAFCSSSGLMAPQGPAGETTEMVDCPMCLVQAQGALPTHLVDPSTYILTTFSDALPPLFLRAPRPLFAWISAQPRAPPALV